MLVSSKGRGGAAKSGASRRRHPEVIWTVRRTNDGLVLPPGESLALRSLPFEKLPTCRIVSYFEIDVRFTAKQAARGYGRDPCHTLAVSRNWSEETTAAVRTRKNIGEGSINGCVVVVNHGHCSKARLEMP